MASLTKDRPTAELASSLDTSWTRNRTIAEVASASETIDPEKRNSVLRLAALLAAIEIAWLTALIVGAVLLLRAVT